MDVHYGSQFVWFAEKYHEVMKEGKLGLLDQLLW